MNISENLFYAIDAIVIAIYVLCVYRAYKNGFLYELINTVCLIGTMIISWILAPVLANRMLLLQLNDLDNPLIDFTNIKILVNTIVWFFVVMLILNIIVLLIKPLFKTFTYIPVIGWLNRLLGILFGFLNATVIVILISCLLNTPLFKNGKEVIDGTFFSYVKNETNELTKFAIDTLDIEQIKLEELDIENYRDELSDWLDKIGIFND